MLICNNGLKITGKIHHPPDYDSMFTGLLIVHLATLLVLLNWQVIRAQAKEEKLYIDVPFMDQSVEKLRLIQDVLPG